MGGVFDVFLEKFADCYSPDTALQINGPVEVCINSSVIYSIAPITGAASYHWYTSNNLTILSGQNSTSINVSSGSVVGTDTISVYGINSCDNGFPKTMLITVIPGPIPTLTGSTSACEGENITYSTETGKTGYVWNISAGGILTGGGTSSHDFITVTWNTPGVQWVSVNYTETNGCTAGTATQINVDVAAGLPVDVTITASQTQVCSGISVTFAATPTNPGATPVYQWKVNGVNAGSNSPVFTYPPVQGDQVQCILTSSIPVCISNNPASSNTITMTVLPLLPVSVSVSASANPVCSGPPVVLTAVPVNGGAAPVYLWKVNGINSGTNSPVFSYTPVNGDAVVCILTSDALCATGSPASSTPVIMTVDPLLSPGVTITASNNPVCGGIPVTYTATPVNGGTSPSYQWKVNGINAGTNSSAYTYLPAPNDSIRCVMTSSVPCPVINPVSSGTITMQVASQPAVTFTACFDTITTVNAKPFRLKGGIPLGGTYSGPGITPENGIFNPAVAGTGLKTITYTYSNTALCSDVRNAIIDVRLAAPFTCGNSLIDIRDGRSYPTVQIGTQCWMATNLNYGTMISSSSHQRDNCVNEKYCYQDLSANCNVQGANYQWDEVMRFEDIAGQQGLCPPGWHMPTETEWNQLFANWTSNGFAAAPLKYSGYSGFNAMMNGVNHLNRQWDFGAFATFFWSSTAHGNGKAWAHGMNDYDPSVSLYPALRSNAFSVRCLND